MKEKICNFLYVAKAITIFIIVLMMGGLAFGLPAVLVLSLISVLA